ncbi:hypothetical protein ACIQ7D_30780 [Streptomyces sp. NPDC096310]|uniref:hypothetical protein n=1 Tax=Streptomyces sp. NPDC096310 TaxID=3366082 RepID=UPI003801F5D6
MLRVKATTKIAFLSGESRKGHGCETPTRLAIAARMTLSRLSCALILSVSSFSPLELAREN